MEKKEEEKTQTGQREAISSLEQRREQPYCQGSWELQQHSVITELSHRGAMGAGTEQNHTHRSQGP